MAGYPKLRAFLFLNRISQTKVAEMIGVSRTNLNMMLNGTKGADFKGNQISTICNELNISADEYFVKEEEDESSKEGN